jgi:hypothetical protein
MSLTNRMNSLVLFRPVAFQHSWLAKADFRSGEAVPYLRPRDWLGHSVLLDCTNDHAWPQDDRQHSIH